MEERPGAPFEHVDLNVQPGHTQQETTNSQIMEHIHNYFGRIDGIDKKSEKRLAVMEALSNVYKVTDESELFHYER